MSRDYKNAQPKKTTRKKTTRKTKKKTSKTTRARGNSTPAKKGIPAWFWFVGGMLFMFIFFQSKNLFEKKDGVTDKPEPVEPYTSRDADISESVDIPAEPDTSVKVEEKNPEKEPEFEIKKDPRFTFYEELPKNEVIIPEEALIDVDKNKIEDQKPLEAITKSGTYYLQAGSFKDFADADRRKAELALFGVQTSIQKVAINDVNWFRVRVGPFTELEKLNTTRQELRNSGVDALVIRVN